MCILCAVIIEGGGTASNGLTTPMLFGARIMGDSDNSTALPSVTRPRLLAGAATARRTRPFDVSTRQSQSSESPEDDPTLRLCEKWQEAHQQTLALCRKHGALEAQLVKAIGFPNSRQVLSNGSEGKMEAHEGEAISDRAIAELAAHQVRWNAMDDQIGYSRMDGLIRQSEATERALLADILLSPASTIDAMLAKLSVILCEAENRDDPEDFPWPHIRSLRNDLTRLHGAEPATIAMPGQQLNSDNR